ncbi:MAG: hypothetical protein HFG80_12255 [Eubacterium sp.]|jgi:hypothetical protein|nr:hypothetical protein [Eubacterium sp.]
MKKVDWQDSHRILNKSKILKYLKSYRALAVVSSAALLMLLAANFEDASAYFTTYVSAGGSQVVHMGSTTELHEDVTDMTKHISVTNASQTNDCFVRVKVFCGGQLQISYADRSENGNAWRYSEEDGYWYYNSILPAGASTEILDVKIGDLPVDFDRDSFNVVVIQECTPVIYDEEGNPSADWTAVYTDYEEVSGRQANVRMADRQGEEDNRL